MFAFVCDAENGSGTQSLCAFVTIDSIQNLMDMLMQRQTLRVNRNLRSTSELL